MGSVYLAEAPGRRVALKILHPRLAERRGFLKRFQREAEAGRRVNHGNVVRTIECDSVLIDQTPCCFLIMEYVEGETLRRILRTGRPLSEKMLREMARQIADGLAAIHAEGIIHRDIKPENIVLTNERVAKIMDLGVAKILDLSVLTAPGHAAGSLPYAAPEQIRGEPVAASDLYGLGMTLYEAATGTNPMLRLPPSEVVLAQRTKVLAPARALRPELSKGLSNIIATLLAKDPAQRFASATALAEALRT